MPSKKMLLQARDEMQRDIEFTSAYNAYGRALSRHSYFRLHDFRLCEDLVQETFAKTWKYILKGKKIEGMKAFLYRVLDNLIVDEYRKRKAVSLDVLLENGYEPEIDETEQMLDMIDGREVLKRVGKLPKEYQRAIRMRYVEGLSLEEMSVHTGCSKNTLSVRIHRALPKLRLLGNA